MGCAVVPPIHSVAANANSFYFQFHFIQLRSTMNKKRQSKARIIRIPAVLIVKKEITGSQNVKIKLQMKKILINRRNKDLMTH